MYREFFGLSDKPFNLTPDPDFLYLSHGHKEALAHLTYGVEAKSGFVMVTGEVGSGKTTLLRALIRNLGQGVVLSQVTNTRVSYVELLQLVLRDFGLNPVGLGKTGLLSALNDFLVDQCREGRDCILLVDEAQNLGANTLEGLRMLSNLETEKAKLLHTILVGQPGLRDLIDSPELEQLRQRVSVRYHLGPLSAGEVGEYIRHRLARVAMEPQKAPVFPDTVIPSIHAATGGIPRLVNVLCDAALLHGYVEETRTIGERIVEAVAAQITRDQRGREQAPEPADTTPSPDLPARIDQLEAKLEAALADVRQGRPSGVTAPEIRQKAAFLLKKERELSARAEELGKRAGELEQKEAEFRTRLAQMKDEWKKRIRNLEQSRQQASKGEIAFPPLRVYAFDPDPRIRNNLSEVFRGAGMDAQVQGDYAVLVEELRESDQGGWFPVAILGSGQDDAENAARMAAIASELRHIPRIYLSDLDLSTLRRKIFAAGANCFLEKPDGRSASFVSRRDALEQLNADLVRTIQGLYDQYRAFFARFFPTADPSDSSEA